MMKLIIIVPLFFSTLFVTSYVNKSLIDLINNNYRTSNFLISYGGGGGGGGSNSTRTKAKEKAKILFKIRQAEKKAAEGMPLTEEEKRLLYLN